MEIGAKVKKISLKIQRQSQTNCSELKGADESSLEDKHTNTRLVKRRKPSSRRIDNGQTSSQIPRKAFLTRGWHPYISVMSTYLSVSLLLIFVFS